MLQCKDIDFDFEKMPRSRRVELPDGELWELLEARWIYNSLEPRGWLRLIPSRTARMVKQGYIKYQGRLGQKKIDALTKQHPDVYQRWQERDIDSAFDDLLRRNMAREGSTRDDTEAAIEERRWRATLEAAELNWLDTPDADGAKRRQELWLSWGGGRLVGHERQPVGVWSAKQEQDELHRKQYVNRIQLDANTQAQLLVDAGKRPTLTATPDTIAHDMWKGGEYTIPEITYY